MGYEVNKSMMAVFKQACTDRQRLGINYWTRLRDEPSLSPLERENGLPTYVEGHAVGWDDVHLHFERLAVEGSSETPRVEKIRWDQVVDLVRM